MRAVSSSISLCILLILGANGAYAHSRSSESVQNLHSFCDKPQCGDPFAPVSLDGTGDLFGVAEDDDHGLIYELVPQPGQKQWKYKTLHMFCQQNGCPDGGNVVQNRLVVDVNGNLFGTTRDGGTENDGTIYELSPDQHRKWTYTVIYSFCSEKHCRDGITPIGNLSYAGQQQGNLYDGVSPLYGTTSTGGRYDSGAAYAISPQSGGGWQQSVIYSFCVQNLKGCPDGSAPAAGMTMDVSGNLYGLTASGGTANNGTAFKLAVPTTVRTSVPWIETVLHSFCTLAFCADGVFTFAEPVLDGGGNFYGVTYEGGTGANCPDPPDCGLLYEIAADGTFNILHEFCSDAGCADGTQAEDMGGMRIDGSGNVYGTAAASTKGGGGLIFEYNSTNGYQVLYSFCARAKCLDGSIPSAGPTLDSSQHLFGTTSYGGKFQMGIAYELSP